MEYIDIYDDNGKSLGIKKPRKEVHEKGLWHKSVHIWVINSKKEILIQRRSSKVNHPNMWDISVAGHVSAGENDITTVLKEAKEEIGLDILKEDLILIGEVKEMFKKEGYINNEINPVYVVKTSLQLENFKKQDSEVAELKFIPYKELKNSIENKNPSFLYHPQEFILLFNYLEKG